MNEASTDCRAAGSLIEIVCRAVLCAEPSEISLLYILWFIHSGQGIQRLLNIENGAQVNLNAKTARTYLA